MVAEVAGQSQYTFAQVNLGTGEPVGFHDVDDEINKAIHVLAGSDSGTLTLIDVSVVVY